MTAVLIRENSTGNASGTSAIGLTGVAAGNCLIAFVTNSSGSTNAFTVTDDSGSNTWSRLAQGFQSGAGNTRIEIWAALNVAAGSPTITGTSAGTSSEIFAQEWSGIVTSSATDVATGGGSATATTFGTVAQTTTNPDDLLIAAVNYNTVSFTNTATHDNTGGIWTPNTVVHFNSQTVTSAYAVVSATGSYSDSWTVGTTEPSGWVFASLKLAAVVPPGVSTVLLGGL